MDQLLTPDEKRILYALPSWTDVQRNEYFHLSALEEKTMVRYHNVSTAIYFVLKLTFFKVNQVLHTFDEKMVKLDIEYIKQRFFPKYKQPICFPNTSKTITRIENKVLSLCGYQRCRGEALIKLKKQLLITASRYPKKRALYKAMLDICNQQNIVTPAQSSTDKIINDIWQQEQQRLHKTFRRHTKKSQRQLLDMLLVKQETTYPVIELRQEMKSFKTFEIDKALKQQAQFRVIFNIAKQIIPKLKIPSNTIDYYASLIHFYKGTQLSRINKNAVHIYLLCYCYMQFQKINDQLLEAFKKKVIDIFNQSTKAANANLASHIGNTRQIRQQVSEMLLAIKRSKHKTHIPKATLFRYVPENELEIAAALLSNDKLDPEVIFWQEIDSSLAIIKRNLQPLFQSLDLVILRHPSLKEATEYTQKILNQKKTNNPPPLPSIVSKWLTDKVKPHIFPDEELKLNRLIFWVYYQLAQQIKSNKLTLKYTLKNKDIVDDLIPDNKWSKNENKILKQFPYKKLRKKPQQLINEVKERNHSLYESVNRKIENGENDSIILLPDKNNAEKWRLKPLIEENTANESVFSKLPKRSIIDIMMFVDQQIQYTHQFDSILPKSAKHSDDPTYINAGILASALGVSTPEMGELSDLNRHTLLSVEKACIRMETLTQALQHIYNAVSNWSLFKAWNINTIAHGSLDGLKLSIQHMHHKARFSKKYLGTEPGMSSYNLILNHFPLLGTLIGTNEYEGHFAFELCQFQKTSQITLEQISTDKHGINSINFILFHLIDMLFAPRIPKLHNETLWGFGNKSQYKDHLIRPTQIMNESNFCQEWSDIQRFVASILTGNANASVMIRKLAAHQYNSKMKLALTHYNHILRSNFILECIQSPQFRHTIERSLNRGEAFNRLYRAIRLLNKGKLKGQNEVELMVSDACTRLLAAIILYYNSYVLNALYEQTDSGDIKAFLLRASPVAWDHINLLGHYVFLDHQMLNIEQWVENWNWEKFIGKK